ncbi:MAG: spondin domain-containing protein [Pseudomonadota bacterium]
MKLRSFGSTILAVAVTAALAPSAFAQYDYDNGSSDDAAGTGDAAVEAGAAISAQSTSSNGALPTVIVTVENAQQSRGVFLTPPWLAIHDGSFDTYDGGEPASVPLGGVEIEALAEDGNNGPLSETFRSLLPDAPEVTALAGPGGPLAPGDSASIAFYVDPSLDRYFSYASMIIPSNDFFIANGNPRAHLLFNEGGGFVGQDFTVGGAASNDAGTEVNDEFALNVAFLGQAGPNTGESENGVVTTPAPGFADPGTLTFPDGVLSHAAFGNTNFGNSAVMNVSFRYVDLNRFQRFDSVLDAGQEVGATVGSNATGEGILRSFSDRSLQVQIATDGLSGRIQMAHLHLGAAGSNGPVIANLGDLILSGGRRVFGRIDESVLTDAFDGDYEDFLRTLAAGNVYINIHTEAYPAGEIRGQVSLRER